MNTPQCCCIRTLAVLLSLHKTDPQWDVTRTS